MTFNKSLLEWVEEVRQLCNPFYIHWCDGSEKEKEILTKEALKTGELIKLNQEKLHGCYYHQSALNDVARTEDLTYVCTPNQEETGPTNNWMSPEDAYKKASEIFAKSMTGRTMYIIPFSMGPIGSPFSKIGVEITDSIYVVLSMRIMTRMGQNVLDRLGTEGEFTKCLHSKADLDIKRRLILHFPQDNTIWSVGSGYGGNALLGKKCLSLRLASCLAKKEGWLAEHMLIMGIEDPAGDIEYITAAFPSACGKTNLAMLIPPEGLKKKGYRIWTVGDDIAWLRIDSDGRLWAVNPENGFFGVAPGTNSKTNLNAIKSIAKDTIYTNVLLKENKTVWWEGGDGPVPQKGINWQGREWTPDMVDENGNPIYGAHPNSRFTAPITNCPSISHRIEHHHGVPISAIVFGGRRASLAPLVYESFNWQHGVFIGATMASERTAAQFGKQGEVRRDPMAMLPFCGYNINDYFRHWLEMGKKMTNPPKIFHVNWFRKDKNNNFLWPGYNENLRVLEWIIARCQNKAEAIKTPIGYVPTTTSLDMRGLNLPSQTIDALLKIDINEWQEELKGQNEFFDNLGDNLPQEIRDEQTGLANRLQNELRNNIC